MANTDVLAWMHEQWRLERDQETAIDESSDSILTPTRVVHCRRSKFDVYIGRPSKWGNPFRIGPDGDRRTVIEKYTTWLQGQPELLNSLHELAGKTLGCFCAPRACHGDVLAQLANEQAEAERRHFEEWDFYHDLPLW